MFTRKNQKLLPGLVLLLGVLGMAMRLMQIVFTTDRRGLMEAGHPLGYVLLVLSVLALALALYAARTIENTEGYRRSFPASLWGCVGHGCAAVGILLTVLPARTDISGGLALAWKVLGFAGVPALLLAGWVRFQGRKPNFLLHLVPCLFLAVHTVSNYQTWSANPQVGGYVFPLLAAVCFMLFAFYHSGFDVGLEWRRKLTFFALASAYLGLAAVPGSGYLWLYLGWGLWALLDRPAPVPRRRRRVTEEAAK